MTRADGRLTYEYFVLRCVPRVDREEFVNLGVVLFCPEAGGAAPSGGGDFLAAAWQLRPAPLRALDPDLDLDAVRDALAAVDAICRAERDAGPAASGRAYDRFRWLAAPRSTVVQPGPVHGGLTDDPRRELAHLLACLVR
jgi:hypothetical protein